ncbi:P-loop containing nucleoside triphosphate hydrolase protein [Patellaria atrata CBS 101060]|uniref:RNA helicase n=1 Tax=Patellaria atrata CBS 101060 TaxID=1346257 RepID=A0A9P4S335_9PEZI|nr:P-loop containing nucleoside triphosphate hydrolase protein [Patellaria atrata CBS 101060]
MSTDHRSKSKKLRRRDNDDFDDRWGDEEDDGFEESVRSPKRARLDVRSPTPPDEDADTVDQRERMEFEKRLKDRDKKDSGRPNKREQAELKEPTASLADLRLRSRQEYLKKREAEQIALLRQQVAEEEEEARRSKEKLTSAELRDFKKNKELLRLALERQRVDEHTDGYQLPTDYIDESGKISRQKRHDALYQRYVDRDDQGRERYVTEAEEWEKRQTEMAKAQVTAPLSRADVNRDDYEFVFDDSQAVKFIADAPLPGARKNMTREQLLFEERVAEAEKKAASIEEVRKSLPMYQFRDQLLQAIADHQILVVVGETGSGKTTQIPQYLHEAGYTKRGIVACTQPRRVAAMSVAARVADEVGCHLGNEVGYSIRFEDKTNPEKTVIKYMTDGMLLRELMSEPDMGKYSAIMLDEAHERTVSTDILMALAKDVARARPDLRLIVSSATLDAQKMSAYLDNCPIFNIPGRTFPVEIMFTAAPEANYLAACVTTIFQIHISQPLKGPTGTSGDILVFMTGEDDITAAVENVQETARKLGSAIPELQVLPLYASLPSEEQAKVFTPTPAKVRRCIISSNIAETSVTLPSVNFVIDPGFAKENVYNPRTGMESLVVSPISRASANQRAGRAGRTGPGTCLRLYTRHAFYNEMEESTTPEILRAPLHSVLLTLKALGVNDLLDFDWQDPPHQDNVIAALSQLYAVAFLNHEGRLTQNGRKAAEIPVKPEAAATLLASAKYGCVDEVITILSMLGESGALFYRPKNQKLQADAARARFTVKEGGDMTTLLRVYQEWEESDYSYVWCRENFIQQKSLNRVRNVKEQLVKLCDRIEIAPSSCGASNVGPIMKAFAAGFFPNAARLQKGSSGEASYRTVKTGVSVAIHPSSVLYTDPPKWLLYYELVMTSKEFMRSVCPLEPAVLVEVAPHYHKMKDLEKLGMDRKMPKETGKSAVGSRL